MEKQESGVDPRWRLVSIPVGLGLLLLVKLFDEPGGHSNSAAEALSAVGVLGGFVALLYGTFGLVAEFRERNPR